MDTPLPGPEMDTRLPGPVIDIRKRAIERLWDSGPRFALMPFFLEHHFGKHEIKSDILDWKQSVLQFDGLSIIHLTTKNGDRQGFYLSNPQQQIMGYALFEPMNMPVDIQIFREFLKFGFESNPVLLADLRITKMNFETYDRIQNGYIERIVLANYYQDDTKKKEFNQEIIAELFFPQESVHYINPMMISWIRKHISNPFSSDSLVMPTVQPPTCPSIPAPDSGFPSSAPRLPPKLKS